MPSMRSRMTVEIHVLDEIAAQVREAVPERKIHLLLENEENEASTLERDSRGSPCYYTAQWNDDVHHALHVTATGERSGYYADYIGDTEKFGRALAEGFAFQGDMMKYLGRPRGEPSAHLPPTAFVSFLQNHDQVGNRAFGDRLTSMAAPRAVRALASVYLLLPQIPMMFMGEEFGASQPFPFFCDFEPELADAVRNGRTGGVREIPRVSRIRRNAKKSRTRLRGRRFCQQSSIGKQRPKAFMTSGTRFIETS